MKKVMAFLIPLVVFVLLTGGANHLTYQGFVTAINNVQDNSSLQKSIAEYQYMYNVLAWYDTKKSQTTVGDVGALYLMDDDTGRGHVLISIDMYGSIPQNLYMMDWTHIGTDEAAWYESVGASIKMVAQVAYGFGCMFGNILVAPLEEGFTIIQSILYLMGYVEIQ